MIIYDPKITGSFQINGSTISSVGEIDSISGSVASLTIASASLASGKLNNTTDTLDGDLTVTGKITAQEFHTEFVSASIIYQSGSTQFGDSTDDTHIFSGSISVSNGITGTLSTAAQPNITSLGTLSSLGVSGNLTVDTNTLFVDAANNKVVIGNTVASNVGLTIYAANAATIYQTPTSGTGAGNGFYIGQVSDVSYVWNYNAFPMVFSTSNTERLRIDSSGNVGIGTNNPQTFLHILGANTADRGQLSIQSNNASNAAKVTWYYDTTNQGEIGTTGGDFYALAANNFAFYAGGNERMRIDSSGNVGIGTSSPANFTSVTFGDSILDVNGVIQVRGDVTNGIATVQFGGSTYRKALLYSPVGTDAGYLAVGIVSNGSSSSASEIARFTSNGLTFNGDTAAANALDDYEEGTFTATLKGTTSDPTTPVTTTAKYTKIGRQVTVQIQMDSRDTTGASGGVYIAGLPFTSVGEAQGALGTSNYDLNSRTSLVALVGNAGTILYAYVCANLSSWNYLVHSAGTGRSLRATVTYTVS